MPAAILQDLAGPKVRIGTLAHGSVELEPGGRFTLTTHPVEGSRDRVSVSYARLPAEVGVGDTLLLADGVIHLRVERVSDGDIQCEVVVGGRLGSRKGVNVPSGLPDLPILGDKDLSDLRVGLEQGIDYLGLSFVRSAEDVRAARAHIERLGGHVPVIAKIETQAALDRFDEILNAADGIMIARGDLSIETPFARVPIVQKQLIAEANRRAKPVITATPDALLDGGLAATDAGRGGRRRERHPGRERRRDVVGGNGGRQTPGACRGGHGRHRAGDGAGRTPRPAAVRPMAELPQSDEEAMVQAACQLAAHRGVDVIVTVTRTGETARLATKYRPTQPIVALTGDPETSRRLILVRGVRPLLLPALTPDPTELIEGARRAARARGWPDMRAVFVSHDRLWTGQL